MRARVQVRELGWEWKPYASWRAVLARFTSAQLLVVRRLLHAMWDAAVQHIMWDAAVHTTHACCFTGTKLSCRLANLRCCWLTVAVQQTGWRFYHSAAHIQS
jgi:hypothetical protein